jgi:hypothetical protein
MGLRTPPNSRSLVHSGIRRHKRSTNACLVIQPGPAFQMLFPIYVRSTTLDERSLSSPNNATSSYFGLGLVLPAYRSKYHRQESQSLQQPSWSPIPKLDSDHGLLSLFGRSGKSAWISIHHKIGRLVVI